MKNNLAYVVVVLIVLADQGLKSAVWHLTGKMHANDDSLMRAILNPYAAFSLPLSANAQITASLVSLAIVIALARKYLHTPLLFSIALIMGGGLSNFIDRVRLQQVIDVITVGGLALNLADVAILTGVLLAFIQICFPGVLHIFNTILFNPVVVHKSQR